MCGCVCDVIARLRFARSCVRRATSTPRRRAKGNQVPIPEPRCGTVSTGLVSKPSLPAAGPSGIAVSGARLGRTRRGNPNSHGEAGRSPRKSCLFCITAQVPWNSIAEREGIAREEHRTCGGVGGDRSDHENPCEGHGEQPIWLVPISAAGLQGEEPLVDRLM